MRFPIRLACLLLITAALPRPAHGVWEDSPGSAPDPVRTERMEPTQTAAAYGYCFKCRFSCGMKGNPPEYKCSQDCEMGWYDDCD